MGAVIVQLFDFVVRAVVYFISNSPNAAKEWEDVTDALMGQEAPTTPEQEAQSIEQARAARARSTGA